MKGVERTLGMHLNVLEVKKNHRLAVIQEQKLHLSLTSNRGKSACVQDLLQFTSADIAHSYICVPYPLIKLLSV